MAITRQKKEEILNGLVEELTEAKSAVFADFRGMNVTDATKLRSQCRKEGVKCVVAKKTLMKLAFEKAGYEGVDPMQLEGSLALMLGKEDEVAPAKLAATFAKEHEDQLKIVAGVLEKKIVDESAVIALSKLPSKQELIAKTVGTIAAPLSGFVNVLQGNIRNLVYALNAVKESKS